MSPLAVFPHFIVLRWCRRARVREVPGCTCVEGDGHLEPTNASVSGLKWPPTHFGGLCSSRRRRGSWWSSSRQARETPVYPSRSPAHVYNLQQYTFSIRFSLRRTKRSLLSLHFFIFFSNYLITRSFSTRNSDR